MQLAGRCGQRHFGLQRRADLAPLAQLRFQMRLHLGTRLADQAPAGVQRLGIRQLGEDVEELFLDAGARFAAAFGGEHRPGLVSRERQDRRHQLEQRIGDVPERGLRAAPCQAVLGRGVETVLQDVQIEGPQLFRAEGLQQRDDGVELVLQVVVHDALLDLLGHHQRVAVDVEHAVQRHGVLLDVEVGDVGQQEAQRVADAAIGLDHALEDLVRDRDLARVVAAGRPQAQDLGTQPVGHFLGLHAVAQRLAHLAALAVHHHAVREQRLVGRGVVHHARGEQRRVEPAAVLVRAFQVQVGREGGVIAVRAAQHRLVRGAGIEPHVQRVLAFLVLVGLVAQQITRIQRLPDLDAVLLHQIGDLVQQLRGAWVQLARFLVQEEGHRHAPLALARQRPVRTVGDHGVQPRLAPGRVEGGFLHAAQGALAQRGTFLRLQVHAGEPLAGGAQDQRRLVPPAVHVAVGHFLGGKERAIVAHVGDDLRVGVPDGQPAEQRQRGHVLAVAHHDVDDLVVLHAVGTAGLEVFHTVGR